MGVGVTPPLPLLSLLRKPLDEYRHRFVRGVWPRSLLVAQAQRRRRGGDACDARDFDDTESWRHAGTPGSGATRYACDADARYQRIVDQPSAFATACVYR